ncbi:MAG: HAD domain-containing protein [Balneolaceae bacterium]|nr:HAD domain-containing protein [Balneolaceae bacterium]
MLGVTPSLIYEEERLSVSRGDEIANWMQQWEEPIGSYVIIDDLSKENYLQEQRSKLVRVHQDKGFAEKEAAIRAGEILATD